jgi:hypothetical protein
MKRKINESSEQETLKEIERTYGKKVRDALVKYCTAKNLDITDTVYETKTDGNGQTPWDKFDNWAEKKLGLDIMGDFDDDFDYTGADARAKRERGLQEVPLASLDSFDEGSGSNPIDEYFIRNWIAEELEECEWVDPSEIEYSGEEPWVEVTAQNGVVYRIQVTKEFAPREVNAVDDLI